MGLLKSAETSRQNSKEKKDERKEDSEKERKRGRERERGRAGGEREHLGSLVVTVDPKPKLCLIIRLPTDLLARIRGASIGFTTWGGGGADIQGWHQKAAQSHILDRSMTGEGHFVLLI